MSILTIALAVLCSFGWWAYAAFPEQQARVLDAEECSNLWPDLVVVAWGRTLCSGGTAAGAVRSLGGSVSGYSALAMQVELC
jgi:hypothetical protein